MKQLLANLNWTFVKAWWKKRDGCGFVSLCLAVVVTVGFALTPFVVPLFRPSSKPKELTPLDMANILTEKVNKLNSQIRAAEKRIETLERLQAGELPQIHGGVSYDTKQQDWRR